MIKKPYNNFESLNYENLVVGYYNGKAIVKNEESTLFYMECPEKIAPEGSVLQNEDIRPISELPEDEQIEIIAIYL